MIRPIKITKTLFLAGIIVSLFSCRDTAIIETTLNVPVYKTKNEIRNSVKVEAPRSMSNTGKIFYKDSYLFISEAHQGIHIINNSDPRNPINEAFLNVPGALDMNMKDNFLYCDSYTDLVVFDLSDLQNITEVKRVNDVFMYNLPEHDSKYPRAEIESEKGLVVSWKLEEFKGDYTPEMHQGLIWGENSGQFGAANDNPTNTGASFGGSNFEGAKSSGSVYGKAGSMARFAILGNNLYALDAWRINVFNIVNSEEPELTDQIETWREMETIFPIRENIFIGTTSGMMIYGTDDADHPHYISTYEHMTSCDPVIVNENTAYVTMRDGNDCGGGINQMDILDIENLDFPSLLTSYPFTNPHGLSIAENTLFVCDGDSGLKIYNNSNIYNLELISHFPNIHAVDVIAHQGILMMLGEGGLHQYSYSDLSNIELLSSLTISQ